MRNVVILIMLLVWALVMNQLLHDQSKQLHDTIEEITAKHENFVAQEQNVSLRKIATLRGVAINRGLDA